VLKFIFFLLIGLLGFAPHIQGQDPKMIMILNMNNENSLPRNFRTCKDAFKVNTSPLPTRKGLDQLNISGSSQFSEKALQTIIQQLGNPKPIYIIDLRQESHGFLNGLAVSWYARRDWGNINLTLEEVQREEKKLLQQVLKEKVVALHHIIKKDSRGDQLPETRITSLTVKQAATEQQLTDKYGLSYLRLGVTDHLRPSDETVDRFIAFVRDLPKGRWLHIHCAAGVGRTTTFMVMYDMMVNAKQVSFDDIIKRQWLLGGLNLKRVADKSSWKYSYSVERLQFLESFYEYCRINTDNFQQSWTSYLFKNQKAA
jgi:predicted protein tyrosine phosphatase